ncbi:MAG: MBL fold metallo-hydrolase [Myxococcota bacterium]|nr:MBL fold metallo-hydrolase [Myxococcota bacterium]
MNESTGPAIRAASLISGSSGNCFYVETRDVKLLIDVGTSAVQVERRLAALGRCAADVDALLVSHDHSDHVRGVGVVARKLGVPVHATPQTMRVAQAGGRLGDLPSLSTFEAGETLIFGATRIETIPTPHDGADGVAFVVEHEAARLGVLTDLGHVFDGLAEVLRTLDAVFLESNHDPQMLERGPYPPVLKRRIAGPAGHLSNQQAAVLAATGLHRLQWACLAHLSAQNNTPALALRTARDVLGPTLKLEVAPRHDPTPLFGVRANCGS